MADTQERDFQTELELVQESFKKPVVKIKKPATEYPELIVTVPDSWETVQLAPLYDVHIGSAEFDEPLFIEHRNWIAETPNVLTWNGGDMFENKTPLVAIKMGSDRTTPEEQVVRATELLAPIRHKMVFSIPGNHEDRSFAAGLSSAKQLADNLRVPYFPDYCFATFRWRNQRFRLLAHHGSGGAQTPGAQRNVARKELAWTKADMLWTGHLHQPMVDTVFTLDTDQKTGLLFERSIVVIISPSYLKYFNGYAAKKRMGPGLRGLSVAELHDNGRIEVNVHARGKRL